MSIEGNHISVEHVSELRKIGQINIKNWHKSNRLMMYFKQKFTPI